MVEPLGAPATKEPLSGALQAANQQLFPFVSLVHSYLLSGITLADQKAGFLFASDSAFLGYLLSAGLLRELKPGTSPWLLPQWMAFGSLVSLGLSIAIAIFVVMPRLGGSKDGLIYFRAIAARRKREHYVTDLFSSTDMSLNLALAEHSYEVAQISTRKYKYLRVGMWIGTLGFLAGLSYVGLTR